MPHAWAIPRKVEDEVRLLEIAYVFGVGFFFGLFVAVMSDLRWRNDCIKRNVARYHPQTGKWEWTVEEKRL